MGGWRLTQSKWHNPFPVKTHGRETSIKMYEDYIRENSELFGSLHELEGKVLGCWCHPQACHGDVLVRLLKEIKQDSKKDKARDRREEQPCGTKPTPTKKRKIEANTS
eukprot:TRINITY_DN302_c0_g1_i2.p1 TRINITY_DN302_c0_g1~~TRINITY_DN302_c0_g1_i2.p1  ORF type:complete len:108 (+),score=20.68 TRINITY_DN302_c0_g1_i2:200-523(+)